MRDWLKKIFSGDNEDGLEPAPAIAAKARGDALLVQGNWVEAEQSYREAVVLAPWMAKAHGNLGFALARQERDAEAEACLRHALELDPGNADTHYMLGMLVAKHPHRIGEALAGLREALRLAPGFEAAHVALVGFLNLQRDQVATHAALADALAHCPACAALLRLRGETQYDERQFTLAAASFEEALGLDSTDSDASSGLANALLRLGRYDEAMVFFERAIAILRERAEGDAAAMFNLGAALMGLGRYEEARTWFERSLALRPDSSETRIARGWLHLLHGEFEAGWRAYRDIMQHGPARPHVAQPLWDGSADLAGKSLLLVADQGMGDALQLVRYVRDSRARGAAAVYLDVQPPLRTLLAAMPEVTHVLAQGEPLEVFDFYCPMSGLPAAFGTTLGAMPDARPYLAATAESAEAWRLRLEEGNPSDKRRRIGVAWSGNPQFRNDRQRSMFLQDLLPLFEREDCRFYLLQKDVRAVDQAALRDLLRTRPSVAWPSTAKPEVTDLSGELHDFAATAAIVANVDVVLTVDTSVAHLAGAMGKPVWIMLPFAPDFRWLLERADSPWYPSARLFRQPRLGDWGAVVAAIGKALDSATA